MARTLDQVLSAAYGSARKADAVLWTLEQRISTPKIRNTDEERETLIRAQRELRVALDNVSELLHRL